jgi:uncharacterized protein YaaR (DUF327 family)
MKISSSNRIKDTISPPSKVRRKAKNFSQEFSFSNNQERKKHLKNLLEKIKKKGKHIVTTNNLRTIAEYKAIIKEYLTIILKSGYDIKKIQHPWDGQNMSLVDIIDKELEELSTILLEEQKDALAIVNKIDSIQGILIDLYK